ncbi:hypothetical protein ACEPAF_8648 [Sanghuangporus sanghuang]
MGSTRKYVFLAAIIALVAWRASIIYFAFIRPPLPVQYFATEYGLKESLDHCHTLSSEDNRLSHCEDATFWDLLDDEGNLADRKLIAGCDPNRENWNTVMGPLKDPNPRGTLWVIDFDEKKETIHELKLEGYPDNKDFHPLGVQIWPSKSSSTSNMFVVNHGRFNATIEQFVVDPENTDSARYVRTITSRYFISPNALALTSPTSFFISNDHLFTRRLPSVLGALLPMIETMGGLPLAFISHVSILNDAAPGAAVIRHTIPKLGVPFPNGIALSPDNRTLAVASSSYARVYFFNRTQNEDGTEKLTYTDQASVPFAPDNLHYDDDGVLLVAGHAYYPALLAVAANKTGESAPSWIVSLARRGEGESEPQDTDFDTKAPYSAARRVNAASSHKIETVYQCDGAVFAGSTTGLRDSRTGTLFVTGLYQEGLLVCRP